MATLYLTCGLQGSGKTTWAKELAAENDAVRLTADDWLPRLYPELGQAGLDEKRPLVESLQWDLALALLGAGTNVVLDRELWIRAERDRHRSEAQRAGSRVVLCLLNPPLDQLKHRLATRVPDLATGVFAITEADLDRANRVFERPRGDEYQLYTNVLRRDSLPVPPTPPASPTSPVSPAPPPDAISSPTSAPSSPTPEGA